MVPIDDAITRVLRTSLYPQIELFFSTPTRASLGLKIDQLPRYMWFSESIRDMEWQLEKN